MARVPCNKIGTEFNLIQYYAFRKLFGLLHSLFEITYSQKKIIKYLQSVFYVFRNGLSGLQ